MRTIAALVCLLVTVFAYAADKNDMKLFDGDKYRYTIEYPSNWLVYDHNDGTVVFKRMSSAYAYPTTVNIQTIYTKKAKGTYKDVQALMDDFIKNAEGFAPDIKILSRQPFVLVEPGGARLNGEEVTMNFTKNGKALKQWQVMVMTKDGNLFQAWGYRASSEKFDENLGLAKKMLHSWRID